MKRNQRTEKVYHSELKALTEQILLRMGSEGTEIRRRLQSFYRQRRQSDESFPGDEAAES